MEMKMSFTQAQKKKKGRNLARDHHPKGEEMNMNKGKD